MWAFCIVYERHQSNKNFTDGHVKSRKISPLLRDIMVGSHDKITLSNIDMIITLWTRCVSYKILLRRGQFFLNCRIRVNETDTEIFIKFLITI